MRPAATLVCHTLLFIICSAASIGFADTPQIVTCDGYPILNFSFGANVARDGEAFRHLFFNRPQLGEGLDPLPGGQFQFRVADEERVASDCATREVTRRWPFATVKLNDPAFVDVEVELRCLVPNAIDNVFVGTLPVALAEIQLSNRGRTAQACVVRFDSKRFLGGTPRRFSDQSLAGMTDDKNFVAWIGDFATEFDDEGCEARVSVPAETTRNMQFVIGRWEPNWPSATRLAGPEEVVAHVARFWDTLIASTERLSASLPHTGDDELDEYLRWYTSAGVAMTRALKDGTILTMGYHELNQRDSFWTTWAHLVLWPSLEKRMIQESVWGQRADGKVPTTILPLIERKDDVDINAYFILRGLRYVKFHQDHEFGRQILPALLQAADWLISRDQDGDGLPEAGSFWYDWKDVSGVESRRYSPHAAMLYVAALGLLGDYAAELGQPEEARRLRSAAERGNRMLQAATKEGGLWGETCYQQIWEPGTGGRAQPRVLQDQVVGILLGVVNDDRSEQILKALRANDTPWGVCETFPYHDADFGYAGGDYHNGGIWPWLNHVHAWALFKQGHSEEAIQLLKKVARADLEADGDFIPHEYLHGRTGAQSGVPMQGWNAAMFGSIYFGLGDENRPAFPLEVDTAQ